jgi:hypothetical protein
VIPDFFKNLGQQVTNSTIFHFSPSYRGDRRKLLQEEVFFSSRGTTLLEEPSESIEYPQRYRLKTKKCPVIPDFFKNLGQQVTNSTIFHFSPSYRGDRRKLLQEEVFFSSRGTTLLEEPSESIE